MKTRVWPAVLALAGVAGCGVPGFNSSGIHWDDPAGDVIKFSDAPDRPILDIVRVEAQGRDGALRLRVRMKEDLNAFFGYTSKDGRKYGGVVAGFFIDTDHNANTGGQPMFHKDAKRLLQGYEIQVSLMAGYEYKDGPATASGTGDIAVDTKKYTEIAPLVSFGLNRLKQGSSSYDFDATRAGLPSDVREQARKATAIKGEWVEVAIPYAWLGVREGATIRLCFHEPMQDKARGDPYSGDKLLRLGR